jgi:hypothetical protein
MKRWRAFLVLLLVIVASTSWAGPILIYKGTGKQFGKAQAIFAGPVNQYILIDPATQQVATITYYVRNGQKFNFRIGPSNYRRAIFALDSGKSSAVYNLTITFDISGQYATATKSLRGTYTSLKVSSQQVIPFLHPRTLFGFDYDFADTDEATLSSELRFTVTFQQKRTVAANDANQTLQQAYDALVNELIAKGFD